MGGSQTPKLPQYETYQKNLEVASKSEHDIQELKKASAFGEAPNKILGGSQQNFGRLPTKVWEAPNIRSDQLTRSDKNHSQTQVTQSHFLTLSDVSNIWHMFF